MSDTALLDAWRDHLALGRRRSPNTVRAYCATARRFLAFCAADDWPAIAATQPTDLRRYLAARREEGLGNSSVARELSAVKAFIAFAAERADAAATPALRMRGPRTKPGLPRPVTPDDIANLMDVVFDNGSAPWIATRDRAVLLLLYGAGLRISEALAIPASACPMGDILTVIGKGAKERVVPILPVVARGDCDISGGMSVCAGAATAVVSRGERRTAQCRYRTQDHRAGPYRTGPARYRDPARFAPQLRDAFAGRGC